MNKYLTFECSWDVRMFKGETSHIDYNKLINYYVWWPRIKMAMKELVLS